MTLLFMDGFDAKDAASKWVATADYAGGAPVYTSSTRFSSGFAVSCPDPTGLGGYYRLQRSFTPSAHVFAGAAIRSVPNLSQNYSVPFTALLGDGGTTCHLYVVTTSTGAVQVWRGNAQVPGWTTSGPAVVPNGTMIAATAGGAMDSGWHYVELGATIDSSTGTAVVRIDGVQVISFTGNTRNGGTSVNIDAVAFESCLYFVSGFSWTWIGTPVVDDLYVCNALGAANNSFLGDVRVQTLLPTGAGSSTQLTATGGANWANVAAVPDNPATYNSSATPGLRDTYAMADVNAGTASVLAVQQATAAFKTDTGTASLKAAQKSGATVSYGTTRSLGTSAAVYLDLFETNPATSASWTASDVNALEAGVEVV